MKNRWKVEERSSGLGQLYRVYRLIDTEKPDQYGNREYAGEFVTRKKAATAGARILNKMEDIT